MMEFQTISQNEWSASQRSTSVATIKKELGSNLTFITVTGGMLPLSTLEMLAEGARMISNNPAIGNFSVRYGRVAIKNKLMQLVESGSEDRLTGFLEGVKSVMAGDVGTGNN